VHAESSYGTGRAMVSRIGRCWRVFGTGLAFFSFGVGGLILRILVFPLLNLIVWEHRLRIAIARNVIRISFRAFVELMRALGVLRYDISGLEKLGRNGLLILANHPTLIDTVFLMAFVKRADCIVKSKLWNNPFTHGPVRAAGYINNEHGQGLIEQCIASLCAGNNLIIFPEGTRTPGNGTISFKRGAANIAIRGMRNVTPVVIRCTPPTLSKGEKWWRVPVRWVHFSLDVRADIDVRPFIANSNNEALAARHLTDYLQDYFAKENAPHAAA
jgi:1-acyl-sn-glycerol-3-phosphate acyltransferase